MSTTAKYPRVCAYCGADFLAHKRTQETCSMSCRAKRQHQRAPERLLQLSQAIAVERRAARPAPPPPTHPRARTVAEAKALRLARERATGQRTYTITDGWVQRPGAGRMNDGDLQGGGWS